MPSPAAKSTHLLIMKPATSGATFAGHQEQQEWAAVGKLCAHGKPPPRKQKPAKNASIWKKKTGGVDYFPGFFVAQADLTSAQVSRIASQGKVTLVKDAPCCVAEPPRKGPEISARTKKGGYKYSHSGRAIVPLDTNGGAVLPFDIGGGVILPFDVSRGRVVPFVVRDGLKNVPRHRRVGAIAGRGAAGGPIIPLDIGGGVILPFDVGGGVILPFDQGGGVPLPFSTDTPGTSLLEPWLAMLQAFMGGQDSARLRSVLSSGSLAMRRSVPPPDLNHVRWDSRMAWNLSALGISPNHIGGKGVKVAVLDTGLDLQHPDFKGRTSQIIGRSFVGNRKSVQDGHGHGTHCCGIIAGPAKPNGNKNLPRYGIAPEVTLLVGKVLDDKGEGSMRSISEGIAWAATEGARVICLSFGKSRLANTPFEEAFEQMASAATGTRFNSLLVAAAGNFADRTRGIQGPIANPAACPSFMAVGAINSNFQVCDFSSSQVDNVGLLDVCAPGEGILSAVPGGYQLRSGTSAAAPHVAGVATLYLENNTEMSVNELWAKLELRATAMGDVRDFGRGLVRVQA